MTIFFTYLIAINIIAFITYGIDKRKARKGKWRIPERTLILLAILGGSIGSLLAMKHFRHKTQHKKFTIGVPVILAIQFLLPVALLLGGGCYLLSYSLNPDGKEKMDAWRKSHAFEQYPGLELWCDSMQQTNVLRDTFIVNDKDLRLHALYAQHPNAKGTVILVHGYTDTAWSMMMLGRMYYDSLQFNILLPEHERHGLSQGEAIQMGWLDRINLRRWMTMADELWPNTPTLLHGISMGAATVMMASGDELPKSVKGIVEDCGYTSVWDEFSGEIQNQFGLPVHPLMDVASQLCQWRYGWNFKEASALQQVAKSTLPMLFIHGDADTFVPTAMVYPLYDAKQKGYRKLWLTPGTAHAQSYHDYPEQYLFEVRKFTDVCFNP